MVRCMFVCSSVGSGLELIVGVEVVVVYVVDVGY